MTANQIAEAMQQGQSAATATSDLHMDPVIKTPPVINKNIKWQLHSLKESGAS